MKKTTEPSLRIGDKELQDSMTAQAAKTAALDNKRLQKEAELHRAVRSKLTPDDSTPS